MKKYNLSLVLCLLYVSATCQDVVATVMDESSAGANDGAISLTMLGGFSPYTFSWEGPFGFTSTEEDISSLFPGKYRVTVTDALCSTLTLTETVRRCNPILSAGTSVSCPYNSNGSMWVLLAGSAPFSLIWSDGVTQTASAGITTRTGLKLGIMCVTVTNAYGCTETICRNISSPVKPIQLTANVSNGPCNTVGNGSITLGVTGGVAPYTYSWSGSTIINTKDRFNLSPGTYCVTVSDVNGCSKTACYNISTIAGDIKIALVDVDKVLDCFSPTCDGFLNIEVSGGTQPYAYSWTGGSTSQDVSNLCAGNYTVTVTDRFGCSKTASYNICCCVAGEPGGPPAEDECNQIPLSVNGQVTSSNATQGGSINLTIIPNNETYSIIWKRNGQLYAYQKDINNLSPGNYCVTVSTGCTDITKCFNIVDCSLTPSMTIVGNTRPACPEYSIGAVSIKVLGGTEPLKYKWSNGSINEDLNDMPVGTYTVTVYDANNCTASATYVIASANTVTQNEECTSMRYCGDVLVETEDFTRYLEYDEDDCSMVRVVCDNGYEGPWQPLGTYKVYIGRPDNCTIRAFCYNGEIYKTYNGTTTNEWVYGIDDCQRAFCYEVSYCFYNYPEFFGVDPNSIKLLNLGNITVEDFPNEFCEPKPPSSCGYHTYDSCVREYFCNGLPIGTGCGADCLAAPPPLSQYRNKQELLDDVKKKISAPVLNIFVASDTAAQYGSVEKNLFAEIQPSFRVWPNPFHENFVVKIQNDKEEVVTVSIMDMLGRSVERKVFNLLAGVNELSVEVDPVIPPGIYVLKLSHSDGRTAERSLVKIKN
jgi:hypothetical protein